MMQGWGESRDTPGGINPSPSPHQLPFGPPKIQVEGPDAIICRHLQPLIGVAEEDGASAGAWLLTADGEATLIVDGELHILPTQCAACKQGHGSALLPTLCPLHPEREVGSPKGPPDPRALTHSHLLDQLGSSMAALDKDARPAGEVPVGLHAEDVHLHALPGARPGGKGELRAQGGRAPA